jgi:hypothetical protein
LVGNHTAVRIIPSQWFCEKWRAAREPRTVSFIAVRCHHRLHKLVLFIRQETKYNPEDMPVHCEIIEVSDREDATGDPCGVSALRIAFHIRAAHQKKLAFRAPH